VEHAIFTLRRQSPNTWKSPSKPAPETFNYATQLAGEDNPG
jgi:hypothetical protein